MSSGSWTVEYEASVTAPRLFKAAALDYHILAPKIAPHVFVSGAYVEGDGAVGSVRQINFTSVLPFSYVKERFDFVDNDKYELKQTVIEGGNVGTKLESLSIHIKLEPKGSGSVAKVTAEYKYLPDVSGDVDIVEKVKEMIMNIVKTAEGYLLANPDAYV